VPYPAGNHTLPPGGLAALLDPMHRYIGKEKTADGLPPGADITGLASRIPWAAIH
jgi:hypothetical protein